MELQFKEGTKTVDSAKHPRSFTYSCFSTDVYQKVNPVSKGKSAMLLFRVIYKGGQSLERINAASPQAEIKNALVRL